MATEEAHRVAPIQRGYRRHQREEDRRPTDSVPELPHTTPRGHRAVIRTSSAHQVSAMFDDVSDTTTAPDVDDDLWLRDPPLDAMVLRALGLNRNWEPLPIPQPPNFVAELFADAVRDARSSGADGVAVDDPLEGLDEDLASMDFPPSEDLVDGNVHLVVADNTEAIGPYADKPETLDDCGLVLRQDLRGLVAV